MTLPGSPAVGLPRDHLGAGANSLWKGRPANLQGDEVVRNIPGSTPWRRSLV